MAGDFAQSARLNVVISRRNETAEIGRTALADAANSDNSMLE